MAPNPFEFKARISRQVKRGKNLSFEEAYLDMQNEGAEVLDDERYHLNYRILSGIVLLCIVLLFGRIFILQAVKGSEYRSLAEGNKLRVQYILAPRGLLQDRYGKVIAANKPSFEAVVVPADLVTDPAEFEANLKYVSETLGKSYDELLDIIRKMDKDSFQGQTLAEDITKDQALILIGQQSRLKGFFVQNNAVRDYKEAEIFTHLIGYTGKITESEIKEKAPINYLLNDYIGKSGIEYQYENYLRGILGKRQSEIDAQGNFKKTLAEVPALPGNNVTLNIDYDLQKKIYESMLVQMKKFNKTRAAAVATNPKTGEVLALVSLPSFDNNMFARGISKDEYSNLLNNPDIPLLNRVLSGTYPPGSTVKPMLAVAALTEGVVTPQTKILDDGVIRIGSFTFYGYERGGLGVMDIYSAIARSSDIYFYTVGGGNPKIAGIVGLGPERLANWYRKFNLGSKLGIDMPNEKEGLVPDPAWKQRVKNEPWYLGNTYHYSIGQGDLLVTPLQVNSWTATIANGGKVMQPYILNQVMDKDGKVIDQGSSKVIAENQFDPKWIKVVQDGMRQAVTAGSARSLSTLPMEISGKTGTAQFDGSNLARTHAWFTSYAPSNDPQIALTVLVEAGGEGSSVSVPISKEVYSWWIENRYNK